MAAAAPGRSGTRCLQPGDDSPIRRCSRKSPPPWTGCANRTNWPQQAARHEAAVAALEQAITARKPAEELHRLHREAEREGEMPRERGKTLPRAA